MSLVLENPQQEAMQAYRLAVHHFYVTAISTYISGLDQFRDADDPDSQFVFVSQVLLCNNYPDETCHSIQDAQQFAASVVGSQRFKSVNHRISPVLLHQRDNDEVFPVNLVCQTRRQDGVTHLTFAQGPIHRAMILFELAHAIRRGTSLGLTVWWRHDRQFRNILVGLVGRFASKSQQAHLQDLYKVSNLPFRKERVNPKEYTDPVFSELW